MSQIRPEEIVRKTVLYRLPGMNDVAVRRDAEYAVSEAGALGLDLYVPRARRDAPPPVVVIVAGYPDAGVGRIFGCGFREMGSTVSWARLIAASGLAAATYTNREPVADLRKVLRFLRENADALNVDASRMGLLASFGSCPLALSLLMNGEREPLACAALLYGYTLDAPGSGHVAEASKTWGFANPGAGRALIDVATDVPLLLVRAGRDETPHLNESLDRFAAWALERNLPISLVNHPTAPHAFDLFDDSEKTRAVIAAVLAFLESHTRGKAA